MSYIAFDLDALNVCPQVGAACGLTAAEASHGLLQLWAWCFRSEQASVTDTHLRGFFQGREAGQALEAFGFLARADAGWRVKGAERYLRVKDAQRAAGKASQNLKRGKRKAGREPGVDLRVHPESTSGSTSGSLPALTPSTEHRAPNTESKDPAPASREPRKPDPRFGPLVGRLKAAQREHAGSETFTDADGAALKKLLARGDDPNEIVARYVRGLTADQYSAKCATVLQLLQRWVELGIVRGERQGDLGIVSQPLAACDACGAVSIGGFANITVCGAHLLEAQREAERINPSAAWRADLKPWAESLRTRSP